jgi:hypothetical protein
MPEARKQPTTRLAVRDRAQGRCEYCLSPDDCSSAPFTIEHIIPVGRGGPDVLESLAWACGGCNGSKGIAMDALDPETGALAALFNPRRDRWEEHFTWDINPLLIIGKSAIGRATIARLHLNRPELLMLRRLLTLAERHPPNAL